MHKWYSLIDKVYSMKNLSESFVKIKKNKGSRTCGIDGQSVSEFELRLEEELCQIQKELKSGTYTPQAVKRVYIDKPDGSKRPLGIPTLKDRVVQQSLLNVLQPIFEPDFHPSSYGYRPGRSAHHAIAKAELFTRRYNLEYVVDMDLSKCFDTLDHQLILSTLNRKVSDGKVLSLVDKFLKSGILDTGNFEATEVGSPQGGIISPLLMNIYMDDFDQYMKQQGIRIVRYADDILIFARTQAESGKYLAEATEYLEKELLLTVNKKKTHLTNLREGIRYLGVQITNYGVLVSQKSINRFKDKVRMLTPRNHGKNIDYFIKELNMLLRGFTNYYRIARSKSLFKNLMSWVRRRLRMKKMKEWKSWKPLHKQLRRMGYKGGFEKISVTRWRNSNCKLIHMALPNEWFIEKGLFCMDKVETDTLHQYYDLVLNKV
jgi:RNA-directed DNA polymerase